MKTKRTSTIISGFSWLSRTCAGAAIMALLIACVAGAFAQSVEKAETGQQAREKESELERARVIVENPKENKPSNPETGRTWGVYSTTTSLDLGYRFVDTDGNNGRYLSDVNVRDGFRVLGYSLDMRARPETALLFDFNLKLFPQRAVRINAGYSRSMAKGRYTPTYNFERDQFQLLGQSRWEANDYRLGLDATYRKWDFNVEQLYRNFHNDPHFTAKPGGDLGLNLTDNGRITTLSRDTPFRSRSLVTRFGVHGNIAERLHVAFRALHDDERIRAGYLEIDTGRANNGSTIISRTLSLTDPGGVAKRPGNNVDVGVSLDVNRHLTISNTFSYADWRISGDMSFLNVSVQRTGAAPPTTTTTTTVATGYVTDLSSFRNTLEASFNFGRKFSADLGWRAMNRDVKLAGIWNATSANPVIKDEAESIFTNSFIGGMRYRPTNKASFMFDVEHGQNNNAFIRIAPLDFTRTRVRAQVQATDKLWFNGTFTSLDRSNPTPQVENESTTRSYSASVSWEPHPRAHVDFGYDYHDLFATALIDYTLGTQRVNGRSLYYSRINSLFANTRFGLTNRLDLLLAYYYIMDRGNPSVSLGPNDQVNSYPLRRHNPEARLAYRFSNNVTGNISYRHYSYNERDFTAQDYRANILTTSLRFTF